MNVRVLPFGGAVGVSVVVFDGVGGFAGIEAGVGGDG